MADAVSNTLLSIRPLNTGDAAGLFADIVPASAWQPSHTVRSQAALDTNIAAAAGLAAAGDVWRVRFNLTDVWPGAIFVPVRFHGEFYANTGTRTTNDAFWRKEFAWSTTKWRAPGGTEGQGSYRQGTLGTVVNRVAGASPTWSVAVSPSMEGFPSWPVAAETSVQLAEIAVEVGTFDATVLSGLFLAFDAGWLVYPRSSARSAGLYVPEQYVTPQ